MAPQPELSCLFGTNSRQHCDKYLTNPSYELIKTSPLVISPQLFHYKLKTLVFSKSYPDSSSSSLPPSPSELQKPSECLESIYLNDVYYSKFQDNNAIVNSI